MRPIRSIFSPVSGWNAESKIYLALQSSSSVRPGATTPCLEVEEGEQHVFCYLSSIMKVNED